MTTAKAKPIERFRVRRPCEKCPFRTDIPPFLTVARAHEIQTSIYRGDSFWCHETVDYDRWEDDDGETADFYHAGSTESVCAGSIMVAGLEGKPDQLTRVAEGLEQDGFDDIRNCASSLRLRAQHVHRRAVSEPRVPFHGAAIDVAQDRLDHAVVRARSFPGRRRAVSRPLVELAARDAHPVAGVVPLATQRRRRPALAGGGVDEERTAFEAGLGRDVADDPVGQVVRHRQASPAPILGRPDHGVQSVERWKLRIVSSPQTHRKLLIDVASMAIAPAPVALRQTEQ